MGKTLTETLNRQVPVVAETEVLVIGGGPAGIAAALASARTGARTMLVERYGYLGGMATAGLVQPIMTTFDRDGDVQIIKGIFDDFVAEMEGIGGAIHPSKVHAPTAYASYWPFGHDHVTPFDPEAFKIAAYRMMRKAGVALRLHTVFVEPLMDGSKVRGAVLFSKSGFQAVRSRITIDCTGDADVARGAGCQMQKGRKADGLTQPVSLFFRVRDVDEKAVDAYVAAHPYPQHPVGWGAIVQPARERGEFPADKPNLFLVKTLTPGVWAVNGSRLHNIDSTNADDMSRAEEALHEQVLSLVSFFRANIPGFEKAELLDTANTVGVRESYRIVGEYVVTLEDINEGRAFEDAVALGSFWIDIHGITGHDDVFAPPGKKWCQVPYRSLVPLRVDNLLVAGRCLSATHEAAGSLRVMGPCFATGHAAGAAAALAVQARVTPRKLDPKALRDKLLSQNACLAPPP